MIYINPSLPKALRANNLLSGNEPSKGWCSQYLGNPRSLSLFLPTNAIKISPTNAEVPANRGTSVSSNSSSHTVGSSNSEETQYKKRSVMVFRRFPHIQDCPIQRTKGHRPAHADGPSCTPPAHTLSQQLEAWACLPKLTVDCYST